MAKLKINGEFEFEGSSVKLKDGVLYIDGEKAMDFPYDALRVEADGAVDDITADKPLSISSVAKGAPGASAAAFASASSGENAAAAAAAANAPSGDDIAKSVQDTLAKTFSKGFPFK